MGSLIAFAFNRSWAANDVLTCLEKEAAFDDAFAVECNASGRFTIKRASKSNTCEDGLTSYGELWNEMTGMLFLNSRRDRVLPCGGSALFMILKTPVSLNLLRVAVPYRGRILKTSLPRDTENRLKVELARAA